MEKDKKQSKLPTIILTAAITTVVVLVLVYLLSIAYKNNSTTSTPTATPTAEATTEATATPVATATTSESTAVTDTQNLVRVNLPATWKNNGFSSTEPAIVGLVKTSFDATVGESAQLQPSALQTSPTAGFVQMSVFKFVTEPDLVAYISTVGYHASGNKTITINGYTAIYFQDKSTTSYTDDHYLIKNGDVLVDMNFRELSNSYSANGTLKSTDDETKYLTDYNTIVNSIKFN